MSLAALMYSFLFAYVLQALPQTMFLDRLAYLRYAEFSNQTLFENLSTGILRTLANEPLWLLINIGLAQFLAPDAVLRTVIFTGAFAFSYVLLRSNPRHIVWLMVFLLSPAILKNYITHLRQGLAMALFFAGYFSQGRTRGRMLMSLAPFVHASFFFILPIMILCKMLRSVRLAVDVRLLALAVYAVVMSLTLGVLSQLVQARQAGEYEFQMAETSGLGFLFWSGIVALLATQGRQFIKEHEVAFGILFFYLISYFFIEVTARGPLQPARRTNALRRPALDESGRGSSDARPSLGMNIVRLCQKTPQRRTS